MNQRVLPPRPMRVACVVVDLLTRCATSLFTSALAGAAVVALATWAATGLALALAAPAPARAAASAGPRNLLPDPTRPPQSASPSGSSNTTTSTATSPRGNAPALRSAPPAPPAAARLQALHLPHGGQASALIEGQVLLVGERFHEWTVQTIRADGVLLSRTPLPTPLPKPSARPGTPGQPPLASPPTVWLSLLPPLVGAATSSP
jgi:hypothetical protein